ncbi:MAG: MMPL family transporter [Verrucomicrobiota bacterium]
MKRYSGIALALGVAALAAFSVTRITFNVNLLDLLPPDLPEVKGLSKFMDHFSRRGELILTMEGKEGVIAEDFASDLAEFLESKGDLVKEVQWQPRWKDDPVGFAELPAFLWFNGDPERAKKLVEQLEPSAVEAKLESAIEEMTNSLDSAEVAMLGYDPLNLLKGGIELGDGHFGRGIDEFGSEDGSFHVLYVAHGRGEMNYKDSADWLLLVEEAITEWQGEDTERKVFTFGYTGEPAFQSEVGGGMEEDMSGSIVLTITLVLLLFWLMHRRLQPLMWMTKMLALILALTVIVGGLLFGKLSVMSVGFAAILIGLAVDYGVVVYTECRQSKPKKARELIGKVGPSVAWAALTTAAVFLALNFSSLPGIRQLGSLVAVGILFGAAIMLVLYAKVSTRRWAEDETQASFLDHAGIGSRIAVPVSLVVFTAAGVGLLVKGFPSMWTSFDALRPAVSPATEALEYMAKRLSGREEGRLPLIVTAPSPQEMIPRLDRVKKEVKELEKAGLLTRSLVFDPIWANPEVQSENRKVFAEILGKKESVLKRLEEQGFSEDPVELAEKVFSSWERFLEADPEAVIWPTGEVSQELLSRAIISGPEENALLGSVLPAEGVDPGDASRLVKTDGAYVTGWETLGPAVRPLIIKDIWQVFVPMAALLVIMLAVVFRCWKTTFIALCSLGFSGFLLISLMAVLGMRWNFLNVCAFPLLLGTGIDYSIHMLMALRRHNGDLHQIRRGIGRALVFCGGSSAIGFGSLGIANNVGLASLGQVCAMGILITMASSIYFLPAWWRWMFLRKSVATS